MPRAPKHVPSLNEFVRILQRLVPVLHRNYPHLYDAYFVVRRDTKFELVNGCNFSTNNNQNRTHRRVERMNGYTVEDAYGRLFRDVAFYNECVKQWKNPQMWLNNLGMYDDVQKYKTMRNRWVKMYNKPPSPLIQNKPPPCPQLAQKHVHDAQQQYDYAKSGDAFAVGTKRTMSINEIPNPTTRALYKKARQQCPATPPNHQPRGTSGQNEIKLRHTTYDIKQKTKKHKSVESSFAMYHPGVSDHAICTVTDTKGL
jgi:hypothetical protein